VNVPDLEKLPGCALRAYLAKSKRNGNLHDVARNLKIRCTVNHQNPVAQWVSVVELDNMKELNKLKPLAIRKRLYD
jgi:hypothetical protein